jgi:hypothetical protein
LDLTRQLEATDTRDHLYGTFGLASMLPGLNSAMPMLKRVNYSASVTNIFTGFARSCILQTNSLALLSSVGDNSAQNVQDLPSWVPDYSTAGTGDLPDMAVETRYDASKKSPIKMAALQTANVLGVFGYMWDTINDMSENITSMASGNIPFEADAKLLLQIDPIYANGQERIEAYWRARIADHTVEGIHPVPQTYSIAFRYALASTLGRWMHTFRTDRSNIQARIRVLLGSLGAGHSAYSHPRDSVAPPVKDVEQFESVYERYVKGGRGANHAGEDLRDFEKLAYPWQNVYKIAGARTLFKTEKGFLGLAMKSVEVGDTVWILPGSVVPLILRCKDLENYEFMGSAYLHGFMHGECFDGGSLELQKVNLV